MENEIKDFNTLIFGKEIIEETAVNQLHRCMEKDSIGVLTADAHMGYSHPIGGAIAYKNKISLSGVGFDIACGNMAVQTDIKASDVDIQKLMNEISNRISFGVGRINNEPVDHPVLEKIRQADFIPQRQYAQMAANQLGTVGSGNHFVDIFEDSEGFLWIGVHFGSRGFGHKTTTGFIALSQRKEFGEKASEGGMDAPPILFDVNTDLGQAYISALNLAGEYANAGRETVVQKVMEILSIREVNLTEKIHNHHNFAWKEIHFGESWWVVRKGCTPAFPGQHGFIGANMMDNSVIIMGRNTPTAAKALFSTVHGAGRVMSRTKAAGKKKWVRLEEGQKKVPQYVTKGLINYDEVKLQMKSKKIELKGGGADEAPACYKNLKEVLDFQGDTIEIQYILKPLGVAMAGAEIFDPYKD